MIKVFLKTRNGGDAQGLFDENTKELIVLKGSRVGDTVSSSPCFRGTQKILTKRQETTRDNIVQNDVVFKSCSTAANYITGNSSNGYRAWKDKNGKALKQILEGEE